MTTYIIIAVVTVGVLIFLIRRSRHNSKIKFVSQFHQNPVSVVWNRLFNIRKLSELELLEQERQREEARATELRKILEAKRKLAQSVSTTAHLQKEITDTNDTIAVTRGQKSVKKVQDTAKPGQLPGVGRAVRR